MTKAEAVGDFSLQLNRMINAPRSAVFKAWTETDALTQWYAPTDEFKTVVTELDVRPGGCYRVEMHDPDGSVHTVFGEYIEVTVPKRLVFTWAWENSDDGAQMLVTVDLSEKDGGTALSLLHEKLPSENARDLHNEGWTGCLDRLGRAVE